MGLFEIISAITLVTAIGLIILIGAGLISIQDIYNLASSIVTSFQKLSISLSISDFNGLMVFLITYVMLYALLFFAVRNPDIVNFIILAGSCLLLWNVKIYGIPASYFGILGFAIWIRNKIS